jgi:peptidyl-prolyl cis-trans isomerase A (cyclophilin A)
MARNAASLALGRPKSMLQRIAFLVLLWLCAPAVAQPAATARVALETDAGLVVLDLEPARAPVTTANFLRYVDERRLDGTFFYRAMRIGPSSGLVQGGVRDPARLFPPIAHESTAQTGLAHVDGAISMARLAPGTAQADFFISAGPQPAYDARPGAGGDNLGFAVFGRVVQGMEVVRRILAAPTSPTEGEGVMRGQMLAPRIRINSARRVD